MLAGLKLLKCQVTVYTDFEYQGEHLALCEKFGPNFIVRMNLVAIANSAFSWKEAVAHELVHIEQMYAGKLHTLGSMIFWKGEDWTNEAFAAHIMLAKKLSSDYYRKLPWEAEAFDQQASLAIKIEESMYANS